MLSRRRFLQMAGIAVSAAALPHFSLPTEAAPALDTVYGRALDTVPVFDRPGGSEVARMWSDTVAPVLSSESGWYRLPTGWAKREGLQPMIAPDTRSASIQSPPFLALVSGAVAAVRAYCAADAPLVTRVGHGGVLHAVDRLQFGDVAWYGVSEREHGDLLGWTQAANWSPVQVETAQRRLSVIIERQGQQLTVTDGAHALLTAPVSAGQSLQAGAYTIAAQNETLHQDRHHGAPWALDFGEFTLAGAYWHNQFGSALPGTAVQVTPMLAQWLYPRVAEVIIS